MNLDNQVNIYMYKSPGDGIFDIESLKEIAYYTTHISSDSELIFPEFINYCNLVSKDGDTRRRMGHFSKKISENCNFPQDYVIDKFVSSLEKRAYTGFYGEASFIKIIEQLPTYIVQQFGRGKDVCSGSDILLKNQGGKKIYISIKSSSYLTHDPKKRVKKDKDRFFYSNLNGKMIHVFYNFKSDIPYFVTEFNDYFYFPGFKVDLDSFKEFLEKILSY